MGKELGDWSCAGQTDLTDLVETEHIPGSMPASEADNVAARDQFYQQLIKNGTERKGER